MRKRKGNEKRRGAQRVPSTGQTASEEKNIMENGNFAIEQFYNCQGNAKTAETPSMENVVSEEKSAHSAGGGWRVAANGMKREEKQTARYFCTISQ